MLRTLRRCAVSGQLVRIVYLDRRGNLSERVIRVRDVEQDWVKAYCLSRRGWRVFAISNILAAMPVGARTGTGDG